MSNVFALFRFLSALAPVPCMLRSVLLTDHQSWCPPPSMMCLLWKSTTPALAWVGTGKKIKVWYGMYREDAQKPDGGIERRQRNVRLGSLTELPTKAAAYEALTRHMGKETPSVDMRFSELVEKWNVVAVPTIKNTTATYYKKELNVHIVPAFGQRKIATIGRYDIEAFLAEKAQMYCRNTLRGMKIALGRVLSWAVSCGWLEKNPCAGVKLPHAGTKVKRTVLTPEQTIAIAGRLDEPYSTLVLFMAVSGTAYRRSHCHQVVGFRWRCLERFTSNLRGQNGHHKNWGLGTQLANPRIPSRKNALARRRGVGVPFTLGNSG
jgi:Phage integrase, N-terminal SAM-like domain